jgi:hypothetical protein
MILIVATNWLWIPFLLYYDTKLRNTQTIQVAPGAVSAAPSPPERLGDRPVPG